MQPIFSKIERFESSLCYCLTMTSVRKLSALQLQKWQVHQYIARQWSTVFRLSTAMMNLNYLKRLLTCCRLPMLEFDLNMISPFAREYQISLLTFKGRRNGSFMVSQMHLLEQIVVLSLLSPSLEDGTYPYLLLPFILLVCWHCWALKQPKRSDLWLDWNRAYHHPYFFNHVSCKFLHNLCYSVRSR